MYKQGFSSMHSFRTNRYFGKSAVSVVFFHIVGNNHVENAELQIQQTGLNPQ